MKNPILILALVLSTIVPTLSATPPEFPEPGPIVVQNTDGSHSLVVNGTHYKLASPPEGVEMPAPPPEGGSYPFTLTFKPESVSQLNTNTTVFIYSTTNVVLPLASWPLLTNVPGTWSNLTVNLPNQVQFFTGVESNKLGLGSFFPVESKPLLPGNRTLEIRKD